MDLDLYDHGGSSFTDYLSRCRPEMLPASRYPSPPHVAPHELDRMIPTGTTILALKCEGGVVIGGDRRATEGSQISANRIEKVYKADQRSAIAIAGAAGPCVELVKLFQTELEHYEKLEDDELSFEGKANKLAHMVRENFPLIFQGLVVIPIFSGYDIRRREGRIFKYDVTGGRYEETDFYAVGSGGKDARNTIKEHYRRYLSEDEAVKLALAALYSAAEEDVGTGGPDPVRGIYPTLKRVGEQGVVDIPDDRLEPMARALIESRKF